MYVATLIANPAAVNLTAELVARTRTGLSAGPENWLADQVACDLALATYPDGWETVWEQLQAEGIDLVIQPARDRRKKVLLADMDSTMIQQECIDELAAEAGVGERVAKITARAMNGELDFEAALRERVGLLKGLPESVIQTVLDNRISLMPGGQELVATMKAHGAYCALVSGGFVDFTSAIATQLGFDEHRANTLLRDGSRLSGTPGQPILGREAKVDALKDIIQLRGLTYSDVIAVGDGANDLGMLQLAGTGAALHAKPIVAAQCSVQLNHTDLAGLLFVQGYSFAEFSTPKP
ncbi:MAG: phosphoserine phosphatase SerB [Rhodobacteraceae bacterium]|nr:phosphoserine phosphatase SerB [Paracoccaceae bacterium]